MKKHALVVQFEADPLLDPCSIEEIVTRALVTEAELGKLRSLKLVSVKYLPTNNPDDPFFQER